MPMTFGQFSEANRRRCEAENGFNHPLNSWSTSDWFLATNGELGEACNVAKKLNRFRDGIPGNKETEAELRQKLADEIGDTFVYLDLLAQSLGLSVAECAAKVFNEKSAEIGYPVKL
jgi:NTP pyrophosphatase (non-canonical NTP hydrolase)